MLLGNMLPVVNAALSVCFIEDAALSDVFVFGHLVYILLLTYLLST